MGVLHEKLVGEYQGQSIVVRADNHVLRGLIYKLFVNGEEVADAQNYLKIPSQRTLEAEVDMGGTRRKVVLAVTQRMLRVEFELTVDGESVPLTVID